MSGLPDSISSRRNPLIRRVRALHHSSGRKEMGLILLEGTHLLRKVFEGIWCLSSSWLQRNGSMPMIPWYRLFPGRQGSSRRPRK
jgi:hypothetical protein